MLTRAVKEKLADDVSLWLADGLISPQVAATLRARYDASGFGLTTAIKYLGISGGLFAFLGLLGLVGTLVGSALVGGLMIVAVGSAFIWAGIWLGADARRRYALSSKVVLALGAMGLTSGIAVVADALRLEGRLTPVVVGTVVLPLLFFLSYRFLNPFLLILAVLGLFHWVGSWDGMVGRNVYEFDVQDPRLMAVAALFVLGIGLWHERLQERFLRFFQVYEALALVYLNLSLLILSLGEHHTLAWVLTFTGATLAQVALGARLKNGLVLGFGITFAAIDLFTRYYERFWDKLSFGVFLLLGGAVLFGLGAVLERLLRLRRATEVA